MERRLHGEGLVMIERCKHWPGPRPGSIFRSRTAHQCKRAAVRDGLCARHQPDYTPPSVLQAEAEATLGDLLTVIQSADAFAGVAGVAAALRANFDIRRKKTDGPSSTLPNKDSK